MEVQFKEWACTAEFNSYQEGNAIAIELIETQTGEPVAVATVNIDGLMHDEVAIKDYSENEGMLMALILAGIVKPPHRYVRSGFVTIPIVRLELKTLNYLEEQKALNALKE